MNFVKKHLVFIIFVALALGAIVFSATRLASSSGRFEQEKIGLQSAMYRWQQLHGRDPYPSQENVERETENAENLLLVYSKLAESLKIGQLEEEEMEAADFMPLLEHTLRRMRSQLDGAHVEVPEHCAFAFSKYAEGQLPEPPDIPRLVQQLRIVEKLCGMLAEAGVSELISISRQVFESSEAARSPRAGRRAEQEQPIAQREAASLYTTQSFSIAIRAREYAALDVLNKIAEDPMFMVVTSISMISKDKDVQTRAVSRPVLKQSEGSTLVFEESTREQRVALGKEELEVSLVLDVYHFAEPAAFTR